MRILCGTVLAAALAVAAVPAAYSEIKLVEPAPGAVVPLLTDAQKAYVSMDRQTRREKFADAKFRSDEMGLPAEKIPGVKRPREAFWPKTVRLAWEAKNGEEYRIVVRDTAKGTVVIDEKAKCGELYVDNLEIAASYEWTVEGDGDSGKGTFKTEDRVPRLIRFPGVPNVRDLGGYIGFGGRRARQGMIFRSAGLNSNAQEIYYTADELKAMGKPTDEKVKKGVSKGKSRVEGENGAYILARFGIKSDIDLRSDRECYGMTGSPLGDAVTWFHYPSSAYGGMQGKSGKEAFAKVFKVFLDKKNYPIDFHCILGRDRTAAVAFILGALLGYDENILSLDWELTGFRNRSPNFNHKNNFDHLVGGFAKNYPADTIQESVEKYVRDLGFTDDDIAKFRSIMLYEEGKK